MDFTVQPRSLAMFRAEQMLSLAGPIRLEDEGGKRRLVNGGELELRDAILIDRAGPTERRERWLGTIAAGAAVEIDGQDGQKPPERVDAGPGSRSPTPSWRSCERTGNPARKTRENFAWSPGWRGRPAGK